jgi:hypothetical protein
MNAYVCIYIYTHTHEDYCKLAPVAMTLHIFPYYDIIVINGWNMEIRLIKRAVFSLNALCKANKTCFQLHDIVFSFFVS